MPPKIPNEMYIILYTFNVIKKSEIFTCINKSTAVVESAKMWTRQRQEGVKLVQVIFKPRSCEY